MPVSLPPLPYAYDALEPHIDAQTMTIHHTKHHQAYVDGFNKAEASLKELRDKGDAAAFAPAIQQLERLLAFHGGGHVNHSIFWETLAPAGKGGGGEPTGPLADQIKADFGSFAAFKMQMQAAAVAVEGSGWAWLTWQPAVGKLLVQTMMNQQNLHIIGSVPLLGVDVWEHAYYLKYQNKRADYVTAWWNVVNWGKVSELFAAAKK
jgi:Fe-Mn family superoxide dismutase